MTVFLTLAEGAKTMPAANTFAARLANRLNTSLHGISAMPDPTGALLMTGAGAGLHMTAGASVIKSIEEAQETARKELEDAFRAASSAEGVFGDRLQVSHLVGIPEQEVPKRTLLSDAVVFPHDCAKSGGPYGASFEYTLMTRRQPIIVAGTDENPDLDTVLIAWDGSPEAARAVRFHERLILAAKRVVIAQNTEKVDPEDEDGPEDPVRVREWLEARNMASTMRTFDGKVADGLLRLAKEENAGAMVAGAFGHSRVEELFFGGVSRSLLRADDGPALALSH